MPLFICDKCGCIDNTATGHYWCKDWTDLWADKSIVGKALCAECAPAFYKDGTPSEYGKWHDRFPKILWDGKIEVENRERKK